MASQVCQLKPTLPSPCLNDIGRALQTKMQADLSIMEQGAQIEEEQRESYFRLARKISTSSIELLKCVRNGDISHADQLFQDTIPNIMELINNITNDPCQRESKVSSIVEKVIVPRLLLQFFLTGNLAQLSEFPFSNDEEYVGAVIGFCQELCRYAVNRACEGDASSIELCRCMVVKINKVLIAFDFRNGPLRRKFDSLKYSLKSIEDIAFELSLHGEGADILFSVEEGPQSKKSRMTPNNFLDITAEKFHVPHVDEVEFDTICQRMAEFDKQREQVIKDSRDVQKWAKQAVFAAVRGQCSDAQQKLNQARIFAAKIFDVVNKYPTLRPGSFSNALEEYAEGVILLHWIEYHTIPGMFEVCIVNEGEYIGGLSDFTGEIGRIAVIQAAKRELESVKEIQQVLNVVANFISQVNVGNRFNKKLDAVYTNLRKVEEITYELSMLQRSGRSRRINIGDLGVGTGCVANDDNTN